MSVVAAPATAAWLTVLQLYGLPAAIGIAEAADNASTVIGWLEWMANKPQPDDPDVLGGFKALWKDWMDKEPPAPTTLPPPAPWTKYPETGHIVSNITPPSWMGRPDITNEDEGPVPFSLPGKQPSTITRYLLARRSPTPLGMKHLITRAVESLTLEKRGRRKRRRR